MTDNRLSESDDTLAAPLTRMDRLSAVRPRLLSFARLQLRDNTLAEDAVQEALMAAIKKDASFAGRSGRDLGVRHRERSHASCDASMRGFRLSPPER